MTAEAGQSKGKIEWFEVQRHVWRLVRFCGRVVLSFLENKGLLLAGAVAYNTLLSAIPMSVVFLLILSRFFDEARVLEVIEFNLEIIVPGQGGFLTQEVLKVLEKRQFSEWLGVLVMLFFSTFAFKTLEDAISIIFRRPLAKHPLRFQLTRVLKRDFWLSAVIPYAYIMTIGMILTVCTIVISFLESFSGREYKFLGVQGHLGDIWHFGYWLAGFALQALLFASIYKVMPVLKINVKRALIGGFSAALLWELSRRLISWYFENVSFVSRIYGSLTTVVIILLLLEVAAIIVLLGAQVIAELRFNEEAGIPWYENLSKAVEVGREGEIEES